MWLCRWWMGKLYACSVKSEILFYMLLVILITISFMTACGEVSDSDVSYVETPSENVVCTDTNEPENDKIYYNAIYLFDEKIIASQKEFSLSDSQREQLIAFFSNQKKWIESKQKLSWQMICITLQDIDGNGIPEIIVETKETKEPVPDHFRGVLEGVYIFDLETAELKGHLPATDPYSSIFQVKTEDGSVECFCYEYLDTIYGYGWILSRLEFQESKIKMTPLWVTLFHDNPESARVFKEPGLEVLNETRNHHGDNTDFNLDLLEPYEIKDNGEELNYLENFVASLEPLDQMFWGKILMQDETSNYAVCCLDTAESDDVLIDELKELFLVKTWDEIFLK